MRFNILTLFPEVIKANINYSILGRAIENGLLEINIFNIRDYTLDKHSRVDDYPYGGGPGMLMSPEPVFFCCKDVKSKDPETKIIYLSPKGKVLKQEMSVELSSEGSLTLLCGHYEGIDQRAIDLCVDIEISIGDFILTGGELAALVLVDSIARNVKGVLNNDTSSESDSFSRDRLEHNQYTRPKSFRRLEVPEVLLSGNHKLIEEYRVASSLLNTLTCRPDLIAKSPLSSKEIKLLNKSIEATRKI